MGRGEGGISAIAKGLRIAAAEQRFAVEVLRAGNKEALRPSALEGGGGNFFVQKKLPGEGVLRSPMLQCV